MCGIAGAIAFNRNGTQYFNNLEKAVSSLSKRGPDFQDMEIYDECALGHARLSIIDLSPEANQPMVDHTGRYTIVYNGEVYNFESLKNELAGKGYKFRSNSDTEVILNLYIDQKEKCLEKLNGFFAFAIYDKAENTFFVARDRLGIKPLYYSVDEDSFLFSSEMKSLMCFGKKFETDPVSLYYLLRLTYIPSPNTIYKNVRKLNPGEFLYIRDGALSHSKYYKPSINQDSYNLLSYQEQQSRLYELLSDSIKMRLVSDVPIGAFLSGGIDSSVVVALASKHVKQLKTFSVGFPENSFHDESHFAALVANKYKTDHTLINLGERDYFESIPSVLDYLGEPFADSSSIAVNVLCKKVREHVTVALSGDGADEVFGGYNKYYGEYVLRNRTAVTGFLRLFGPVINLLPKSRDGRFSNLSRQVDKLYKGSLKTKPERYFDWMCFNSKSDVEQILSSNLLDSLAASEDELLRRYEEIVDEVVSCSEDFNSILLSDVKNVLPNDMLQKVDSMSMANSLEVRVPFLDHRIVDFAFSIPSKSKIDNNYKKKILQDTFRDDLPFELYGRKKQGFSVPLNKWFSKRLSGSIGSGLVDISRMENSGFFNGKGIERLLIAMRDNPLNDHQALVWTLVGLDSWVKGTNANLEL